jgi:hypothetical protein
MKNHFRCREILVPGKVYRMDIVTLDDATCPKFIKINETMPSLSAVAKLCNAPETCLMQANPNLLDKHSYSNGKFKKSMNGEMFDIGCFYRSNYD